MGERASREVRLHMSQDAKPVIIESPREYFVDQLESALKRLKFRPSPLSRFYLVGLLERFMFASNLFPTDDETGKARRQTLADLYFSAQNSPPPKHLDLWRQLGDSSLYISGFFGDSLNRKLVDIEYYVDMGGVAYGALSSMAGDENTARMYGEFSSRFPEFVDVLTFISQESMIQTNEDLLKLYDRYLSTGSRLAGEQLLERGLLNADLPKAKNNKM
jgi:hypothetical protein